MDWTGLDPWTNWQLEHRLGGAKKVIGCLRSVTALGVVVAQIVAWTFPIPDYEEHTETGVSRGDTLVQLSWSLICSTTKMLRVIFHCVPQLWTCFIKFMSLIWYKKVPFKYISYSVLVCICNLCSTFSCFVLTLIKKKVFKVPLI